MSMQFKLSVAQLQEHGSGWHEQGSKSADMAASMATFGKDDPGVTQAAATLSLASAVESLCGNSLLAASAICERLEAVAMALHSVRDEIDEIERAISAIFRQG